LTLDEQESPAKQQGGCEEGRREQRRPIRAARSESGGRGIWTRLVKALVIAVAMRLHRADRRSIRASDDRHSAMIECRHEPSRGERAQCEKQR
jgi:hypothetical protein